MPENAGTVRQPPLTLQVGLDGVDTSDSLSQGKNVVEIALLFKGAHKAGKGKLKPVDDLKSVD